SVRFPVLTSLSVFTVLFLTAAAPCAQQIQGLGFDFAAAVSDDGRTVTGFMREGPAGDVTFTAVKWSEPGVVETLWSANSVSTASGVSADGAVVAGYRCTHTVEDPNVCEAFRHEDGQQTA